MYTYIIVIQLYQTYPNTLYSLPVMPLFSLFDNTYMFIKLVCNVNYMEVINGTISLRLNVGLLSNPRQNGSLSRK